MRSIIYIRNILSLYHWDHEDTIDWLEFDHNVHLHTAMKGFGASGPYSKLFEHFGFTVDNVVKTVKAL